MAATLAQIRCQRTVLLGVLAAAYFFLALTVMGRFVVASSLGDTWRGASLASMVAGQAEKPYVYRVLVPKVIGAIVYLTPQEIVASANQALAAPMAFWRDYPLMRPFVGGKSQLRQAFENQDQYYLRLVTLVVVAECLLFYMIAQFFLARNLFPNDPAAAWFAPMLGVLMALALARPVLYIYDFAVLFLSAVCYAAIAGRRWRWYYVAWILALLNKESAVFVFAVFALWQWPCMPRRQFWKHALAQMLIIAAVKTGLYVAYAANAGPFLKTDYVYAHMQGFLRAFDYRDVAGILMALFLLVFRWQEKPGLAKTGLPVLALMWVAYVTVGSPREYRVFYDVVPLLTLLATHTLVVATGISRSPIFREIR